MKNKLFLISALILFFLPNQPIWAYSTFTTHPALTEQAIDFYNSSNPKNSITDQQKEWIIKGSIAEDIAPRWINHFYDPIYKESWTGELAGRIPPKTMLNWATAGFFTPQPASAIQWINDQKLQKKYAFYGGDHTWKKALEDYDDGNYQEAFISLGHVLHVLEDMSVPDHTRNDTHAHEIWALTGDYGSPYEEYLKKYNREAIKKLDLVKNLKYSKVQSPKFNSIEDYLISLATYSNKYFFSKDTILIKKYSSPQIAFDDRKLGYGLDENGEKFPLVAIRLDKNNRKEFYLPYPSGKYDAKKEKIIIETYFKRLAKQALLHAAGAINLFFQQANQERIQREYPLDFFNFKIPVLDSISNSISNPPAISLVGEAIRNQSIGQSLVANFSSNAPFSDISADFPDADTYSDTNSPIDTNEKPQSIITDTSNKNLQTNITNETTTTNITSTSTISFITTSTETFSTIISTSTIVIPTTTIPIPTIPINIQATPTTSIIYQFAQSNPTTMSATISAPIIPPISASIPNSISTPTTDSSSTNKILISQIKTGEYNNANNQFIELYNPNNQDISLAHWSLQRKISQNATSTKNLVTDFPTSSTIAAKSFFLIASNDYVQPIAPDLRYDNNADLLNYDDNWVILQDNNNAVSNAIYYTQILPTQSWWRKSNASSTLDLMTKGVDQFNGNGYESTDDINDFIVRPTATPKNSKNLAVPRSSPTAPNLIINFSSSSMSLNLQWDNSLDYKNSTSSIAKYIIKEIGSSTISFAATTTTSTNINFPITENNFNKNFSFTIQAVDQEGLVGEISQKNITLPNLSLYIVKQTDHSAAESANNTNGIFYQYLGNNLIGSPQNLTFHAKFEGAACSGCSTQSISLEFFEATKPDYSDAHSISYNACYIQGNDCPNLNFQNGIDKDYTIPIQQPFTFNPIKYYKMKISGYQTYGMKIYGSTNSSTYIYGKTAIAPSNNATDEIPMGLQSLYFLIRSRNLINLPPITNINQMTPMNFQTNYSTSALELNLSWLPPRYPLPNLTYKILDISPAAFYTTSSNQSSGPKIILPLISTTATSVKIPITEVGRKYKFRLWAEDPNNNRSFAVESPDIFIPYSFNNNFIISQQTDGSISEKQGYFAHTFYQTLSGNQQGQLGAIAIKINSPGRFIDISASEINGTSTINTTDIAYCIYAASAVQEGYQNGPICSDYYLGNNIYAVPAINNFIFDPIKKYRLSITSYDPYSLTALFGSSNPNVYPNGSASKLYNDGKTPPHEIPASAVKNFYFAILSSTPFQYLKLTHRINFIQ